MTTIAQQWIEEGIEKGIEEGIEQGIEKGRTQGVEQGMEIGELIGQIKALQQFLKLPQSSSESFIKLSNTELTKILADLQIKLEQNSPTEN